MNEQNSIRGLWQSGRIFLGDFVRYAGKSGISAASLIVLGALLEGAGLILLVPLLSAVTESAAGGRLHSFTSLLFKFAGTDTRFGKLALLLGLFALVVISRAIILSMRDGMLSRLQIGFVEEQRAGVIRRLATASWDKVVRLRHARIAHLMSGDIQRIGTSAQYLLQCAVAIAMLLSQCVMAYFLSPTLAMLVFVMLFAAAIAMLPVLRHARALGTYVTGTNLQLLNTTSQFLGGLKLAISQNLQASFADEFLDKLHSLTARQLAYSRQQTNGRTILATVSALIAAITILIGVGWLDISPAILITLLLILARMIGPTTQILQGAQQLANSLPAYETVTKLKAELATPIMKQTLSTAALPSGPIVFSDVSFSHADALAPERIAGVADLHLTMEQSGFIGIAGPSGAGKTTFVDLLIGLYPPQAGRIMIGDTPLSGDALSRWRDNISYVAQDAFLLHDTIRRNLAWASSGATEPEMWDAIERVGASDLVRSMPEGLDTIVGERGTLISGGERQRIALARAILRRPRLLILDEATNAIDIAGERAVIEHLLALSPPPLVVMVAHRAESLRSCNRVLFFSEGRLTERAPA